MYPLPPSWHCCPLAGASISEPASLAGQDAVKKRCRSSALSSVLRGPGGRGSVWDHAATVARGRAGERCPVRSSGQRRPSLQAQHKRAPLPVYGGGKGKGGPSFKLRTTGTSFSVPAFSRYIFMYVRQVAVCAYGAGLTSVLVNRS